jgi:3-oxoacyl-[acyl-carrier protein] reductase
MLAPIELMKGTIAGMIARKFGRIVNITSHAVKARSRCSAFPTARSGLTGFVAGLARATAEHNVTINNLAAGNLRNRQAQIQPAGACGQYKTPCRKVTEEIRSGNPSRRFGRPEEFGATCAFLCSAQASYITGQNIVIDGGAYPGTF